MSKKSSLFVKNHQYIAIYLKGMCFSQSLLSKIECSCLRFQVSIIKDEWCVYITFSHQGSLPHLSKGGFDLS